MPLLGSLYSPARTCRDGTWPGLPAGTTKAALAASLGGRRWLAHDPFLPCLSWPWRCPLFVYTLSIPVPSWWLPAGPQRGCGAARLQLRLFLLSAICPLGGGLCFQAGKSGQTRLPAQSQRVEFLSLSPVCAESLSDIVALFLRPGECLKLPGLK